MAELPELPEVGVTAPDGFPNFLAWPTQRKIGDLAIQVSIEEVHENRIEVTDHPVESGANITDHSFRRPKELLLRCGWSDSSSDALKAIVSTRLQAGSVQSVHDYVSSIYSQLVSIMEARQPVTIESGLVTYKNMLVTGLQVTRDQKTANALMVEATCREVIIVKTKAETLPAQANQANPAATAGTQNAGTQQLRPGTPAPGGSVPPGKWTG